MKMKHIAVAVMALLLMLSALNSFAQPAFTVGGMDQPFGEKSLMDTLPKERKDTIGGEGVVNIQLWAKLVVVRGNTNEYLAEGARVTWEMVTNGAPLDTIDYRLDPAMVTQFSSLTNRTIWFQGKVWAKGTNMILPGLLDIEGMSSDTNRYLATRSNLRSNNIPYSPRAIGVINNPNGTKRYLMSQEDGLISEIPVHEFWFLGSQSPYFIAQSQAAAAEISAYFMAMSNWYVNSTWMYIEDGRITAWARKTLQTKETPKEFKLKRPVIANGQVAVEVAAESRYTYNVYWTEMLGQPWSFLTTANHRDVIRRPASPNQGYFRINRQ